MHCDRNCIFPEGSEMQKVADAADISVLIFSAGANFWAILGHFGSFLGYFGSLWVIFWC